MRRSILAVALLACLALPHRALADAGAADKAAAEALFNEGKRLMDAGNYAQACPKLADSQKLDPGVGTLLNLGVCYQRAGKTASAWATFKEAARAAKDAGQSDREKFARDTAAALEPLLAKLTIDVPTVVDGEEVKRDGEAVPKSSWGLALPVDPGEHAIEAGAPKFKPWSTRVSVLGSGTTDVKVPSLEPVPEPPPPPPAPPQAAEAKTQQPPPPPAQPQTIIVYQGEPPRASSPQKTWGGVAVAVGVLAVGGGVIGGFVAKGEYDKSNQTNGQEPPCTAADVCTQQQLQHRQDGQNIANISTWVFVGGAVLLAGGITLIATAPPPRVDSQPVAPPKASLTISPALGGATLRGTW